MDRRRALIGLSSASAVAALAAPIARVAQARPASFARRAIGDGISITWLGHAAFRVDTPSGKVVLIDPWLDNPWAPPQARTLERVDLLLVSHGHFDHLGNTAQLAKARGATALSIFEISAYLQGQGVPEAQSVGMNKGGTVEFDGFRVTMVEAQHSSGISGDKGIVPGGDPAGFVLRFDDGTSMYHAGDTNVFGDMRLIGGLYTPQVAMLPIGGHFTMGPLEAAVAARMLAVGTVIPMHYGTFPVLRGTPDQLVGELAGTNIQVAALTPGQTFP